MIAAGPGFAAPNLIKNGTFKAGSKGFTSDYTLSTMTPYLFQDGVHGIYAVELAGSIAGSSAYGDWTSISTDPSGHNSNVYVADAATSAGAVVWSQTVKVTAQSKFKFSFFAAEVSNACCSNAQLTVSVNGTALGTLTTSGTWQTASFAWASGTATTAAITIVDTNTNGEYNDFAMDDLVFKQVKR